MTAMTIQKVARAPFCMIQAQAATAEGARTHFGKKKQKLGIGIYRVRCHLSSNGSRTRNKSYIAKQQSD